MLGNVPNWVNEQLLLPSSPVIEHQQQLTNAIADVDNNRLQEGQLQLPL